MANDSSSHLPMSVIAGNHDEAASAKPRSHKWLLISLVIVAAILSVCGAFDAFTGLLGFMPPSPWPVQTLRVELSTLCGEWQVERSPSVGFLKELGAITSVSAASKDDAWIVGDIQEYADNTEPSLLTLHREGGSWRKVSIPSPDRDIYYSHLDLTNILALSKDNAWTVGSGYSNGQTLIQHWDGQAWSVVPSPKLGYSNNHLYGLAAVTKDDIWAGGHANIPNISWGMGTVVHTSIADEAQTLILHWDGIIWSLVKTPEVGGVNAVASVSANDIWAVGNGILHWDGHTWNQSIKPPAILLGIAALQEKDIWAVGDDAVIMHWDGNTWSSIARPQPPALAKYLKPPRNSLTSIAAISSDDIWAVGSQVGEIADNQYPYRNVFYSLALHWDGKNWSIVPSPNSTNYQYFIDVAAISKDEVWAVGEEEGNNSGILIAHFLRSQCP